MKHTNQRTASQASAEHARKIRTLLSAIETKGELKTTNPNWNHVGSLGAAREALVNAAYHLGVISAEEAKTTHGVTL